LEVTVTAEAQSADGALQGKLTDGSLAGHWTLDPARSSVALRSKSMWGLVPVKGTFGQVTGAAEITGEGGGSGTITIGAASVDTKMAARDKHLRSADFFDTDNHPEIVFTASEVALNGEDATITGSLQVRDQTRPLSVPAKVTAPDGDTLQLDTQLEVDRSDFGLTWKGPFGASVHNTLTIRAVFTRG
jgi:polyisoprenoid-binding protein YceI